ncbi:MAG: cytochrome c [Campylobacterota bacterium]|nr:cytochrome c [Campylobacterota bacterium]
MKNKLTILLLMFYSFLQADSLDGKKVFETYCWGCHHQSAVAFGPPFTQIASKRSADEIKAYILEPKAMYKAFGYKRTVMTQLKLNDQEINLVTDYILSYKGK